MRLGLVGVAVSAALVAWPVASWAHDHDVSTSAGHLAEDAAPLDGPPSGS